MLPRDVRVARKRPISCFVHHLRSVVPVAQARSSQDRRPIGLAHVVAAGLRLHTAPVVDAHTHARLDVAHIPQRRFPGRAHRSRPSRQARIMPVIPSYPSDTPAIPALQSSKCPEYTPVLCLPHYMPTMLHIMLIYASFPLLILCFLRYSTSLLYFRSSAGPSGAGVPVR